MSGFEAVGIILGAWPIVVNAMNAYKLTKNGKGISLLLHELQVEEMIYSEFVHHLLESDISDQAVLLKLSDKTNPDLELWKKKTLHDSLKRRLGEKKSTLVFQKLEEMKKLLASLNEKLVSNDIGVETSQSRRFRTSIRNVRLSLPHSAVKKDLEELRLHNEHLRRLFTQCTSLPIERKATIEPATIPSETFKEIAAHANDLHEAICKGYNCECSKPHTANLGTRQVLPKYLDLTRPFDVLFTVDEEEDSLGKRISELQLNCPTSPSERTVTTEVYGSEFSTSYHSRRNWSPRTSVSSIQSPIGSTSPPKYQKYQRSRSMSFSKSKNIDGNPIQDLCKFVKNPVEKTPAPMHLSSLGTLAFKDKTYRVKPASIGGSQFESLSVICLDDVLVAQQSWDISLQKRMDLAVNLSLAILQLFSTQWINIWWTWKDFSMLKSEGNEKSQIFVTKNFYSTQNPLSMTAQEEVPSLFWQIVGEQILTRLGFALVELAMGQRLSEMREVGMDPNGDHDMLDMATAKRLVESGAVREAAGIHYNKSVEACLSHEVVSPDGIYKLDSKNAGFQLDLEQAVVAPIRDFVNNTFGQI